jgi:hypothetical protein
MHILFNGRIIPEYLNNNIDWRTLF